ncbi:major facilitator superfamily domain-containing protein [Absidia repens]|uniref:Major facilitator superfamily domain-containing protein n=1 Tax=Absidia repens TaxID=90262 RepID=A0A1X2IX37_9FUNG|nr:major facilitator superfamily domain-containing protein [Absidia repens]
MSSENVTKDSAVTLTSYDEENHRNLVARDTFTKTTSTDNDQQDECQFNDSDEYEQDMQKWALVFVGFLAQFLAIGITATWRVLLLTIKTKVGIMQDHLERTQYGSDGTSVFQLSLVASILDCLINLMSIAAQIMLSKFGLKWVMLSSAVMCALGLELASLNSQIWHLILSIGVLFGTGSSIFFYVSTALIPQWFDTKQGISLGIVSSGGSFGGLILPFVMTALNGALGSKWCFRILGFISLFVFGCSSFLIKEKPQKEKTKLKHIVNFSVLKNKNLLIWCAADIVIEGGYFVPTFFIPCKFLPVEHAYNPPPPTIFPFTKKHLTAHATSLGLSETQSSLLISLLSACNAIGRILAGCIVASLSSFVIWTLAYDMAVLAVFACIYGASAGVFAALGPSITKIVEKDRFESGYTMFLILCAISFFGLNVAAAIQSAFDAPYFLACKMFTGSTYLIGALILIYLKSRLCRNFFITRL